MIRASTMLNFENQVEQHIHSIRAPEASSSGKLVRVVGLTREANGVSAPRGADCQVETAEKICFIDAGVGGFHA